MYFYLHTYALEQMAFALVAVLSLVVCLVFWGLYHWHRDWIVPASFDHPPLLNHLEHSVSIFSTVIEMVLSSWVTWAIAHSGPEHTHTADSDVKGNYVHSTDAAAAANHVYPNSPTNSSLTVSSSSSSTTAVSVASSAVPPSSAVLLKMASVRYTSVELFLLCLFSVGYTCILFYVHLARNLIPYGFLAELARRFPGVTAADPQPWSLRWAALAGGVAMCVVFYSLFRLLRRVIRALVHGCCGVMRRPAKRAAMVPSRAVSLIAPTDVASTVGHQKPKSL